MNIFQRTGIFIIRLVAVTMIVVAVMGGCMYTFRIFNGTTDPQTTARAVATVEWLIVGFVLLPLSKPIGKRMGAGLGY